MKKLTLLTAVGAGYVLGARAGRERYEQIVKLTRQVKNNPKVQQTASQAADVAKDKAGVAAEVAKDKASTVSHKVSDKVSSGNSGSDDPASKLNPDSTALQDNPYPQGDLP